MLPSKAIKLEAYNINDSPSPNLFSNKGPFPDINARSFIKLFLSKIKDDKSWIFVFCLLKFMFNFGLTRQN